MTKYEIILYWSEQDQAFIAEVPELSGCAARQTCLFHGGTKEILFDSVEVDSVLGAKGTHDKHVQHNLTFSPIGFPSTLCDFTQVYA